MNNRKCAIEEEGFFVIYVAIFISLIINIQPLSHKEGDAFITLKITEI
jgi:hypothetical protein